MTIELIRRFARNNAWSNHRMLTTCGKLSKAEYEATRTSFFPSIERTLNHILQVDLYYCRVVAETGDALAVYDLPEIAWPSFVELEAAQRGSDRKLVAFCDGLGEADLSRVVACDRPKVSHRERIGDLLAHLFVHQIHHRGQVHAMLAGTPANPPQLDEFFLAQDAALREQDLGELGLMS